MPILRATCDQCGCQETFMVDISKINEFVCSYCGNHIGYFGSSGIFNVSLIFYNKEFYRKENDHWEYYSTVYYPDTQSDNEYTRLRNVTWYTSGTITTSQDAI